ncbi:MAG: glutamine amidotransferase-related protein, partial [Candidatus Bathyarchaeia archaeon]
FGSRGTQGKIAAIRYAREMDKPFLGICFGFQLAVVEYARHIGFDDANSTEVDPYTPHPVIDLMPEQKGVKEKGATMRLGAHEVHVTPGTLAYELYGSERIWERHRHRYEVNPSYVEALREGGLVFSGVSPDGRRMEILEIPDRYFFLATQFHGEFKSRPEKPSPPYYGFIKSCLDRKRELSKPVFQDLKRIAAHT